jgi:hypothetical protein
VAGALAGAGVVAVEALINSLFPQTLPAVIYRLTSVCERNAAGEPYDRSVEITIPQLRFGEGLDARLGALVDIAQGLKDFKQPVCAHQRTEGQSVLVVFQSDEPSPFSGKRKRKALGYRVRGEVVIDDHAAHWKGFEWRSGKVQVQSTGLWWGQPQVWAETESEGKRVLLHAAAIAGADLADPAHRWRVAVTHKPEFGLELTMRVAIDNCARLLVTHRDGSRGFLEISPHLGTTPE